MKLLYGFGGTNSKHSPDILDFSGLATNLAPIEASMANDIKSYTQKDGHHYIIVGKYHQGKIH